MVFAQCLIHAAANSYLHWAADVGGSGLFTKFMCLGVCIADSALKKPCLLSDNSRQPLVIERYSEQLSQLEHRMVLGQQADRRCWLLQAGFIDAFLLRNCMKRQTTIILGCCDELDKTDQEMAEALKLPQIAAPQFAVPSFFGRVSHQVGRCAAHILAVFLAGAVVIALLITATAMSWTTTAQLLCNTPTMIIEGGMLLVLMMAHMASHQYMRARLQTFLQRRIAYQAAFDCQHIDFESLPMPKEMKAEEP